MDTFLADLKYSVRMLIKRPGFSAVAVLTLALAIGANTTIFTLINAVFLHALPVADAPTLVDMWTVDAKNTFANFRRIQTSWDNMGFDWCMSATGIAAKRSSEKQWR